ncbi:MAG: choice-of-anchor Q domain-containing protein, partial [Acidimicrobiales bacterium]
MGEGERVAAHGHRIAPGWRAVRLLGLGLALAAGAVGLAACDPPPPPHTFTVNATLDKVDAVPGDGVCQTSTAGQCTLRAAVQEANAVAGDDTIELQAGSTYTLSIGGTGEDAAARGDLDLASNITVHGHGALVDAKSLDHALQVRSGTIAIDQVTVRGANGSGLDVVGGSAALADSTLTADTVGLSTSGSAIVSASRSTISGASTWGVSVAGGQVTLLDSTIGANGSGGVRTTAGTVAATNTVVGEQTSGPGCSTAIASGGWNLDAGTGCGFTQSTDLQSTPAGLGPLVPSGGPTPTMRPMVGSAAVDSGQPGCAGTDQRGAPRPVDGDGAGEASCDRGAVEVDAWHPLTMTVTSATDAVDDAPGDGICHAADGSCTLRAAIQESDWSTGPDVVTLAASTTYPIRVTGSSDNDARAGDLDVTSPVTIHGNGSLIVDGLAADGIVQVFSTGVAIDHVELHGTNISSLDVRPRAAVDLSDSSAASSGNGVSTGKGSQVIITRSTLTNNTAGLSNNGGTTVIVDSTVASNSRNVQIAGGSVTATNSIIADPMVDASCSAPITSAGWNLSTDTSCGLAGPTDVTTAYAHLGPYVTTGTRVPSRAPTDGSAAIDTGRPGCTGTDQRGQVRPVDGDGDAVTGCDRGAVEAPTWHPLSFVVDTTTDLPDATPGDGLCVAADGSCTLRSAIQESNAANGPDVIDLGVGRTYGVSSSGVTEDAGAADDLDVTGDLTLHGHGSTIAAYLSAATFQVIGGQLSTDHVTISNNYGIAIDAHAAAVTLVDSTVTGNTTAAVVTAGGAPLSATRSNLGAALSSTGTLGIGVTQTGPGSLTLRSTATGAITSTAGQIDIATSTVGGLVIRGGAATLVDSTIVGQHIGLDVQSGSASVTNSIADHLDTTGWDCFGPVTSGGWNLSSDHSCALSGPADLQDSDPRLSGLRGHGGPTPTRIPLAGSPATDSGKPGCAGDDQRGLPRPADGDGNGIAGCDRGAAELSGWNPLDLTVTSSNDSHDLAAGDGACQAVDGSGCTLRAAIEESNVSTGPDTVTL